VPHQFGDRVAGFQCCLSSRPSGTGWRLELVDSLFNSKTTPKLQEHLFKLSSVISTDKFNFSEISEKLFFENKIWVSEKFSVMFLNISIYNSYIISSYFKWFLIKWRNSLLFRVFQYGSISSGEISKEIKLSSMMRVGDLSLIMNYYGIIGGFVKRLRVWRTLRIDYGNRFVMDLLTTISREVVAGLAEWGSAWEDLITKVLEDDLFWLPTLQRDVSTGTIIRENLLYYFEEFCQEDIVPCKATNIQEFLIVWKMEVNVEWQQRSKIFDWPKFKIFRHWWGNKEESEPNDTIELINMSHKPI
jgi:hypothetical protein